MTNELAIITETFDVTDVESRKDGHLACLFQNGWGISIINDGYGRDEGLYEVAVMDKTGKLRYDTGITSDVIGWLDTDGVLEIAKKISELPTENEIAVS